MKYPVPAKNIWPRTRRRGFNGSSRRSSRPSRISTDFCRWDSPPDFRSTKTSGIHQDSDAPRRREFQVASIKERMMNTNPRRTFSELALLLAVALSLPSALLAADKRSITEMDLFNFVWIADPQISPDGSRVVFVRVWVNQKADRYDTALWIVPTDGGAARQLTAGPRDSNPRWSPDGKTVAFIRSAEKEGRPQPQQ